MSWKSLIDRLLGRAPQDDVTRAEPGPEPVYGPTADSTPGHIKPPRYHHDPLPPRPPLRNPLDAVCRIYSGNRNSGERWGGIGVFVAPDKVLTVWHTLEGRSQIMVENGNGDVSRLLRGAAGNRRKTDADLCVLTLERPIAPHILPVASEKSVKTLVPGESKVRLLTRFDGVARNVEALYGMVYQAEDRSWWRDFACAANVQAGYSGSPFINDRGEVISLVVHGTGWQSMMDRMTNDGMTRCGGQPPDLLARTYHKDFV